MTQLSKARIGRRTLMRGAAAAGSLAAAGFLPGRAYTQAKTTTVNLQLGWIAGGNQLGEVCAKQLGYYEE